MDQGAGLPGTGRPLSHVCMVSDFTCKTYMSVNFNDALGPKSVHSGNCAAAVLLNNFSQKAANVLMSASTCIRQKEEQGLQLY